MTDARDAICTLIWNELSCSTHLDYDLENDRICGFVSWGDNTLEDIVDHGLTFMFRGLHSDWIIPVVLGLCDGTTDKTALQQQIKNVVKLGEARPLHQSSRLSRQHVTKEVATEEL